ncbi:MAG TPA: PqqD family protein [Myxococcaceae bacterium]|nr:PqqD family protein [Myxococcaceae bacterium]
MARKLPVARQEKLAAQELAGEWVVYDLERDRAHRLNAASALVWRNCNGKRDARQLAALLSSELGLPNDERVARLALDALARANLLENAPDEALARLTRRQLVKQLGVALAALPLVATLVAPDAMAAQSCAVSGQPCKRAAECCSGICNSQGRCG